MTVHPMLKSLWRNKTGPVLVATQVAIALVALVNMTFIIHQQLSITQKPTGIDIDNIFLVVSEGYDASYNHAATVAADLAYLSSLPGVKAASITNNVPQVFDRLVLPLSTEPEGKGRSDVGFAFAMSADAVETLGLKLIVGRTFDKNIVTQPLATVTETIGKWAPEIVITRIFAEKLFPGESAIGKTVHVGILHRSSTIVGVVDHMQASPISGPSASLADNVILVPIIQAGPRARYLVRAEPAAFDRVMLQVERDFESTQHGRYIDQIEPLKRIASRTRAPMQTSTAILAIVTLFVLLVVAVGLFGLAAFNVVGRVKQIGVRRAVGARKAQVLRHFLIENWLITTVGIVVGCVGALAVGTRFSVMFQMPKLPLIYLVVGVLVTWLIGLIAVLVPARKAASISPSVATRSV